MSKQITKENFEDHQREALFEQVPDLNMLLFDALKKGLKEGNEKIIAKVLEVLAYVKGPQGVNIQTNILNAGNAGGHTGVSFGAIVRKLDENRRIGSHEEKQAQLTEESKLLEGATIDAEFVDIDKETVEEPK